MYLLSSEYFSADSVFVFFFFFLQLNLLKEKHKTFGISLNILEFPGNVNI